VLMASTPLGELGRWLGVEGSQGELEDSLTEHTRAEVFIAAPSLEPGTPLRVNISLEN
jgi:hypothetical protein